MGHPILPLEPAVPLPQTPPRPTSEDYKSVGKRGRRQRSERHMEGTLHSIQQELEEDEDMKDVFFDGGHGSPSVGQRITNAANKTKLKDSKHTPTQSQEQETLSG